MGSYGEDLNDPVCFILRKCYILLVISLSFTCLVLFRAGCYQVIIKVASMIELMNLPKKNLDAMRGVCLYTGVPLLFSRHLSLCGHHYGIHGIYVFPRGTGEGRDIAGAVPLHNFYSLVLHILSHTCIHTHRHY